MKRSMTSVRASEQGPAVGLGMRRQRTGRFHGWIGSALHSWPALVAAIGSVVQYRTSALLRPQIGWL